MLLQVYKSTIQRISSFAQSGLRLDTYLKGGPGGSSLFGLFTENGPFNVKKDGKVLYVQPVPESLPDELSILIYTYTADRARIIIGRAAHILLILLLW